jgi:hypothetical protein
MLSPLLGPAPSRNSRAWLTRVRENLAQLIAPSELRPSSSNGAPIHLLKVDRTGKAGSAQTFSLLTHGGILAALLLLAARAPIGKAPLSSLHVDASPGHLLLTPPPTAVADRGSLGSRGGGGEDNPLPATQGSPRPHFWVQLVPPRLPDNQQHELPVAVTVQEDASATSRILARRRRVAGGEFHGLFSKCRAPSRQPNFSTDKIAACKRHRFQPGRARRSP